MKHSRISGAVTICVRLLVVLSAAPVQALDSGYQLARYDVTAHSGDWGRPPAVERLYVDYSFSDATNLRLGT